jgi:hypothetical protein
MAMRSRLVAIGYSSLDGLSVDDIGSVWRSFARTEQDGVLFLVYEGFFQGRKICSVGQGENTLAFIFVVEVLKMAPVFPASLALISGLSTRLERLVDATLRQNGVERQ